MLTTLFKVSCFMSGTILVLAGLSKLLGRSALARWRYLCWIVAVLGLLLPFRPVLFIVPLPVAAALPAFDWAVLPGGLWAVGVLGFAAWFAGRHIRFMRVVGRWSRPAEDAVLLARFAAAHRQVGLSRSIELRVCPGIDTPMATGFFRPVILIPAALPPDDAAEWMLMHELVHCKRGDVWARALLLAAWAVHWFNPFMLLLNRAMRAECEMACDHAVLRHIGDENRLRYGALVLQAAGSADRTAAVAFAPEAMRLKRRIQAIAEPGAMTRRAAALSTLLLSAVTALTLLLSGVAPAPAAVAAAAPDPTVAPPFLETQLVSGDLLTVHILCDFEGMEDFLAQPDQLRLVTVTATYPTGLDKFSRALSERSQVLLTYTIESEQSVRLDGTELIFKEYILG